MLPDKQTIAIINDNDIGLGIEAIISQTANVWILKIYFIIPRRVSGSTMMKILSLLTSISRLATRHLKFGYSISIGHSFLKLNLLRPIAR